MTTQPAPSSPLLAAHLHKGSTVSVTPHPADEAMLFDVEAPPPVSLADKFLFPPFSVLDRRSGAWQDRKRAWLSMGMRSEVGRSDGAIFATSRADGSSLDNVSAIHADYQQGTSIFDPVVCELVYRWLTRPGARVLDPFAGGSVRGITASTLARYYTGIDLREEQVEANREQAHLGSDIAPEWIEGDARAVLQRADMPEGYDLVFSCPPYTDLEVYSDDPRDLSAMPWDDFLDAYRTIIRQSVEHLRRDRFAAWAISDVRDRRGMYRCLVSETIRAFTDAGAHLYNEAIILDQIGTSALRAERPFVTTRKLTRAHQHLLIFIKGDPRAATEWAAA